ncbi:hypothetical protein CH333_10480 [candidate division WOR-3 bacterium JGI_Cruoil_03_44_89]|uniref:Metallo-beta-lactamase domain-containing protein n=1 Tax=candidate division WOR-3 bacterium JGI_Cruoil_03_44_89 TaxID=1973748 RepID=A0A235BMI5_UNCW3|nr:MAG: hypothetical protein CH333_10480 [candidate division WOR-3 bacterium JGI_Cruoil_03_44_89]
MDRIVFLGTAGARIAVFKQIRASGGIWLELNDTRILIDPGPGSLVKCCASRAKLDPLKIDAIFLSHRHLDHCADMNVMVEAMTGGGLKKRGVVFLPSDALGEDPVLWSYARSYVEEIVILRENETYDLGKLKIHTSRRLIHGVETYGARFEGGKTVAYIPDTKFFPGLWENFKGDILIINVVRREKSEYDHLSLEEAKEIIKAIKPETAIITHFGMTMIMAKPWVLAEKLRDEVGINVIAARDGMQFAL